MTCLWYNICAVFGAYLLVFSKKTISLVLSNIIQSANFVHYYKKNEKFAHFLSDLNVEMHDLSEVLFFSNSEKLAID